MRSHRLSRVSWESSRAVGLLLLRRIGAVFPTPVLWILLWPIALVASVWSLHRGRPRWTEFQELTRLPPFARGGEMSLGRLILGRTRLNLARLLFLWPERLAPGAGVACRISDAEGFERIERRDRPILLLSLHFGPCATLFGWLRARGTPVAVVSIDGRRKFSGLRGDLARFRDAGAGLERCPAIFEPGEVWAMRDHLAARGVLLVLIDGGWGGHAGSADVEGLSLTMNTGSLRLAAATGALVIPCLMRSGRFFSLTLSLGEPVPMELLQSRGGEAAARAHLLREFLPALVAAPEECSRLLLDAIHGSTVETRAAGAVPPSLRPLGADPPAAAGA